MNSGHKAEHWLHAQLESRSVPVLARNYRCRRGEIDLILKHQGILIFVEVRCRTSTDRAKHSVTLHKQRRLMHAARHYLAFHPWDGPCRFDVAALKQTEQSFHCEWIQDAFTMDAC